MPIPSMMRSSPAASTVEVKGAASEPAAQVIAFRLRATPSISSANQVTATQEIPVWIHPGAMNDGTNQRGPTNHRGVDSGS